MTTIASIQQAVARVCRDCDTELGLQNRSGLCRMHFNRSIARDPEIARRKSASLKRYAADPANAGAMSERGKRAAAKRLADPVHAARVSAFMRDHVQPKSCTAEQLAKGYRRDAQAKITEARMAWCPPEYRDTYRSIIRAGIRKAEAVPMIHEMIALHKQRAEPAGFAAQLARVAAGAPIASKPVMPTASHTYSITGNSTGML